MSAAVPRLVEGDLAIDVLEDAEQIRLVWSGRSTDRDPGRFLMPLFMQLLERIRGGPKRIVMDFTGIDYMNSSSFAPIVKLLDEARRSGAGVALEYTPARRWQALSFSALRAFETTDGRIAVRAR